MLFTVAFFFALPVAAIIAADVLTHYTVKLLLRQKDTGALAYD